VVRVAGDRSCDQDGGIEIGFHRPEASLICSSRMVSTMVSQLKPLASGPGEPRCRVLGPWMIYVRPDEAPGHLDVLREQARNLREVAGELESVWGE
jgi:hypothetical protein